MRQSIVFGIALVTALLSSPASSQCVEGHSCDPTIFSRSVCCSFTQILACHVDSGTIVIDCKSGHQCVDSDGVTNCVTPGSDS